MKQARIIQQRITDRATRLILRAGAKGKGRQLCSVLVRRKYGPPVSDACDYIHSTARRLGYTIVEE